MHASRNHVSQVAVAEINAADAESRQLQFKVCARAQEFCLSLISCFRDGGVHQASRSELRDIRVIGDLLKFVDFQQVSCIGKPSANAGYIIVVGRDGGVCMFENSADSNWVRKAANYWLVKQHHRLSAFVKIAKPYSEHVAKREIEWLEWKVTPDVFSAMFFVC
jgi:hypothetical protein